MYILLTGAAGFIGSWTAKKLLSLGYNVVGVDNLNDYYDVRLKQHRLDILNEQKGFHFHRLDIENFGALEVLFDMYKFDAVINLAARAGVRYSIENPFVYYNTNTNGTVNLLELCKKHKVDKFVLASTSSLYAGQEMPFTEDKPVNTPISPYAASKKGAEVSCYTYHYLFGIDVTVVRYFTVYGPAGRPDMSIFRFIKQIDAGEPIIIYGDGSQSRDFTYVEDIAEGTVRALKKVGYEIINLGNNNPNKLSEAIRYIEDYIGKKAVYEYRPFHKADMLATWANIEKAKNMLGWTPKVDLKEGIKRTIDWYKDNYDFASKINLTE
ncbi:GDP-mannose 4,6-dehydratase [Calditerrivibrio nitroreducens]|uniref:NAD-dependent epimerase/dehydratase n=1 Tax=Calditerrivibrio nitroreducens (strain DSM 19672 / NBRC 101217 / Yu37-1) TaxID=768670 RepID=E4TEJ5_CALNY|nr:GDP-mannose 4,6-dehydratase [Calditerrivibrio nitroreducens]ADR18321.1 NAD-dependent epimerase/dehydratase [Calditerrivibrio nitroreducens DSM 19672]